MSVHAERLAASHKNKVLEKFDTISFSVLKTFSPQPKDAVGEELQDVKAHAKYLLLEFESITFVIHLMQGGRLKPDSKMSKKPRGGLARFRFVDEDALLLTEAGHERKAGIWVKENGFDFSDEPFDSLGPVVDQVDRTEFGDICANAGNVRLHGFLRDQHQLSGMGRRLANEICWTAQMSPFSPVGKLDDSQLDALYDAIQSCLNIAIEDERTRDYMAPSRERLSQVHNHAKEPCPRCGDTVRSVDYKAYSVNYCPTCQTAGKILADNTTSKFLK